MDQLHGSVREIHMVEVAVFRRILIGVICCRDDRSLFVSERDNSGAHGIRTISVTFSPVQDYRDKRPAIPMTLCFHGYAL